MKIKRKLAAAVLAGLICLPAAAGAQAAGGSSAVTTAQAQTGQAGQEGYKTDLMRRIRNIIQGQEKTADDADELAKIQAAGLNQSLSRWAMDSRDEGGTLIFSDSPEYVPENGILYRDSVKGDARVLFYHLNNTNEPKKIAVVLKNEYNGTNKVLVTRGGSGQPSSAYLEVGKATQLEYFSQERHDQILLPPAMSRLLQEDMNETILQPGQLTYGVFDFHAEHSVLVTVLMLDAYGDPVTAAESLPVLPKDEMRLRGTFKGMNRVLTARKSYDPAKDGGVYFMLADDKQDKYRYGVDATDGSQVVNYGNYGINYRLELPVIAGQVKYYLSPLGGVYAGAIRSYQNKKAFTLYPTPNGRTYFGDNTAPESYEEQVKREAGSWHIARNTELANLGETSQRGEMVFEFSPPGASNLPVAIVMVPDNK